MGRRWGGCSLPSRKNWIVLFGQNGCTVRAKTQYKMILLCNVMICLLWSDNSPDPLSDLTRSYGKTNLYIDLAEGLGVITKATLGLELRIRGKRADFGGNVDLCQFYCACVLSGLKYVFVEARKRSYRYHVKCEESEFDSDYIYRRSFSNFSQRPKS